MRRYLRTKRPHYTSDARTLTFFSIKNTSAADLRSTQFSFIYSVSEIRPRVIHTLTHTHT